jgi:hypothetical protein
VNLLRRVLTGAFDYEPSPMTVGHSPASPGTEPRRAPLRVSGGLPPPAAADFHRVNALLGHVRGCDCSTCELAAGLGAQIRRQEGLR